MRIVLAEAFAQEMARESPGLIGDTTLLEPPAMVKPFLVPIDPYLGRSKGAQ